MKSKFAENDTQNADILSRYFAYQMDLDDKISHYIIYHQLNII